MNLNNNDDANNEFFETNNNQRSSLLVNNGNTNITINGNVNNIPPPITTTTNIDDSFLQSPSSFMDNPINNSLDSIQVSLDSPSIHPANVNVNDNTNLNNPSPLSNNMRNVMGNLDNQVMMIQQAQQQLLKYQNQLQQMQIRSTQKEKLYNDIQSPPEKVSSKLVTWYPKWSHHNSPFGDKIVFSVKQDTKNEVTLLSNLKKRRNDAKASTDDYNKIVLFCNHLFNSMKYIQIEQSDILNDALKLLKKSVKENCIEACNILAKLYLFGIEGALHHKADYERAGPLFMKVLKNTDQQQNQQFVSEVSYNLALCYENMNSKKKRLDAISLYKFAAVKNHPGAAFKMYKIYEKISPKEAVSWLTRSKDNATKEYPDGLYEYALLSYKGYERGGITKNENYTISLLKEAADKYEHVPSALELGKFYLISEGNTSTNAAKYLHMAAIKDNKMAQYKLATWWDKQPVNNEIKKKAYFDWLNYSAEGDDGLPEAIYRIGCCYEIGHYVPIDKNIALTYFEKSASKGFNKAIEKLEKLKK